MPRDPTVTARHVRCARMVQVVRSRSRPDQACGARPARSDGRCGSSGGRGGRELRSPATRHARLVSSAMSAMHRYASLREVGWKEGESAHLKSPAAAPSCSAPSTATIRGSYGSSCDAASTPCGQQGGWTGTGGTGTIGRRAAHLQAREVSSVRKISPTSSEPVTSGSSLSSANTCERRTGDWQHSAAKSAARRRSSVPGCTCSQVLVVAVDEVGAQNFR